jgi:hypothetical protein
MEGRKRGLLGLIRGNARRAGKERGENGKPVFQSSSLSSLCLSSSSSSLSLSLFSLSLPLLSLFHATIMITVHV